MQQLQQAIEQQNSLMASLYVAEKLQTTMNIGRHIVQLEQFIRGACNAVSGAQTTEDKLDRFLHYFYTDLAFSSNASFTSSANHYFLDKLLDYRTGTPVNLAIVMCQIGNAIGLKLQQITFSEQCLVRAQIAHSRYCYIDLAEGTKLDWRRLLECYRNLVNKEAETIPSELLQPISCEETIVRCLHGIKEAFIQLQQLPDALTCSALLLELSPDDPYERRDRGFLLHQLDCLPLAFKDYDFFIRQCPRDPVAEMLKMQMQVMPNPELILH